MSAAPVTTELHLNLPRSLAPVDELIVPDGPLWLFSRTRAVSVSARTGAVLGKPKILGVITTPPIVGPNGSIWFGATSSSEGGIIEEIDSHGHARVVELPIGDRAESLASGSDGDLWFTLSTARSGPEVGRITTAGELKLVEVPAEIHGWTAPLVPALGGGFWTSINLATEESVAYLSLGAKVRLRAGAVNGRTLDTEGVLWGWGPNPGELYRVPPSGAVTATNWFSDSEYGQAIHGALTRASDNQLWFTGAYSDFENGSPLGFQEIGYVLGTVLPDGSAETWPVPYTTTDRTSAGTPDQSLIPGPDGRLYALANAGTTAWRLYVTALPDRPAIKPARVAVTSARISTHSLIIALRCVGQPGRYCAGTISLTSQGTQFATEPYALAPGLPATRTISVPQKATQSKIQVTITSHSPDTREPQTLSTTASSR